MSRRYKDPDGVVHLAADLGWNHITLCERLERDELYATYELKITEEPTTCLRCLGAPTWQREMHGHP